MRKNSYNQVGGDWLNFGDSVPSSGCFDKLANPLDARDLTISTEGEFDCLASALGVSLTRTLLPSSAALVPRSIPVVRIGLQN